MQSAVAALARDFARRRWWRLLQVQAAGLGVAVMVYSAILRSGPLDPAAGRSLHFVLLWILFVAMGGASLATAGDVARFYLLPLSHFAIATATMVPCLCCVWASYVFTAMTLNKLFGVGWLVWGPALFLAAALGAIQAATRLTGNGRIARLAAWSLIAIPFEGWLRARYGGGDFLNPKAMWTTVSADEWLSMMTALVVEYGVIGYGIARDRCGEGPLLETPARRASEGIFERSTIPSLARRADVLGTSRPFSSPAAAQFWFEWRQKGLILPGTLAAFALFVVTAYFLRVFRNGEYELLHLCLGYGLSLGPIAVAVGLVAGHVELAPANAECGTFLGTRPMTNGGLSRALWKTLAASLLLTWGLWIVCLVCTTGILYVTQGAEPVADLWTDHGQYARGFAAMGIGYSAILVTAFLVSAWTPLALTTALVQTGRQRWIMGAMAANLVAFLTGLFLWCERESGYAVRIDTLWAPFLGCAALFGGVVLFLLAYRQSLISGQACLAALLGWIALCVVAGSVRSHVGLSSPLSLIWLSGTLTLPFAPLAAGPLALAWNRHR